MTKPNLSAEVVKTCEQPETWLVEALDVKAGDIYSATFYGPDARQRAEEYAAVKFRQPDDISADLARLQEALREALRIMRLKWLTVSDFASLDRLRQMVEDQTP